MPEYRLILAMISICFTFSLFKIANYHPHSIYVKVIFLLFLFCDFIFRRIKQRVWQKQVGLQKKRYYCAAFARPYLYKRPAAACENHCHIILIVRLFAFMGIWSKRAGSFG
ncbi:MAG: hypothetical protein B5M56_02840 [Desulfococcus sp. 4484_241]|nr:MAG: hypothetical protein B5M56_02840 [Desulfococcus sp. 4484_241]